MPVVTLAEESKRAGGFYVPQFKIRVAGENLPEHVVRDVIEVTYKDKIDEIDSCEITVNNWDATLNAFKYIGAEKAGADLPEWKLFEPGKNKEVEVSLGYVGQLESVMRGHFTTMEPNFPSSGGPTLQVRILNVVHQLRRKKYSDNWPNMTESQIAKAIETKRDKDLDNAKRFPLAVEINETAQAAEKPLLYVAQKNEYDIDFLWKRAHLNGYVVAIREEDKDTGKPRRLYFGPSQDMSEPVTYKLDWCKALVDLKVTLTTANQYRSVTVRGWDRAAQKPIEAKVDLDDKELNKVNKNLRELIEQSDPREELVVDKPVYTKDEALRLARRLLLEQRMRMVRATGNTIGLPKLRAGTKVAIGNIGSRLSGTYFVTATTHTWNNNGYTTRFEARREETEEGIESGAPV
jgi:phage protein D